MPTRDPNQAAPVVSPLDLAISSALAGEREVAFRHVGAILEEDPGRSVAVLLAGKLLGEASRVEAARRALRTAVELALLEGSLPRAMASVIELRRLGVESTSIVQKIARKFARGSTELMAQGAIPPALPRQRLSGVPLPHTLSGDELMTHVEDLLLASEEHAKQARNDSHVPRQVLLSALSESGLTATLEVLDLVWVDAAKVVVEQGGPGEEAYIVARGELDVVRVGDGGEETPLARLGNGALFGEMALLSRAPRAARVIATRPSLLLVASSEALSTVVEREPDVGTVLADYCRRRMIDNLVRTSRILGSVSASERPELVRRFVTRSYEAGDKLVSQSADAEGLHLIASGEVTVVHQTGGERTVVATLAAGEVVGEISSSCDVLHPRTWSPPCQRSPSICRRPSSWAWSSATPSSWPICTNWPSSETT
ncbi:MAG: cyclic nucleotide-binding domain-containing protein [Polyangiaceae bacterium]